jgi:hypothetical protein
MAVDQIQTEDGTNVRTEYAEQKRMVPLAGSRAAYLGRSSIVPDRETRNLPAMHFCSVKRMTLPQRAVRW